jgi:chaperonin GroEL (HSP60 family)
VKNRQKTISTEEKLHIISQREKGEQIIDLCRNVRRTHSSVQTIRDNADRIKESARSRTKVFVQQDYHSPT